MRIKSFFADSMESALAAARREFGPEAMVVQSKETTGEARRLGACEVVAAVDQDPGSERLSFSAPSPAQPKAPRDRLSIELAEMRRDLDRMRQAISRSYVNWPGASEADPLSLLREAEVYPGLIAEIAQSLQKDPTTRADAGASLRGQLKKRFSVEECLGVSGSPPRIAALVGPPGAGKTTSLVKLAVRYGIAARRPVQILSMDTYRIAAADQLRHYAAIIGAGFAVLDTALELADAIQEYRSRDLILIDTPGFGGADLEDACDVAGFLSKNQHIDVHLVLSASMRSADLSRVTETYRVFRPSKLLFTKLDETEVFGPILSEAARLRLPLSFFGTGQRIPEDLEPATHELILDLILNGSEGRARTAA